YQWLQPDNHRVRLRPKQRPSARLQSVLRRKARGKRLSLVQRNLLQRFQKSSSVLMATCHTCSKTSRHKGMNREFMATHSTPGSAVKHKTPQSTHRANMTSPKTPGKDKTPAHTPRSSNTSGSGSSSSKTPSKPKNWVVQRLSKILMREDNQGSKSRKGGLKDFLSSL
uniref:Si:dkey-184p18.2 n=2 Tax=Cyclopterus lumpus TaxID=8103 RepID=A0A8C3ARS8_CYCLU